eukprot:TRINITY_DN17993_c0_g1_i2.p1 TRINITY_DN17993_c0_g1~~TRINITY_DN17993_c0_g1_i2.p1  ORF type:complete len:279 (+),score=36.03 TRINITY_DN17993_c0_g1_i2:82-837(+)
MLRSSCVLNGGAFKSIPRSLQSANRRGGGSTGGKRDINEDLMRGGGIPFNRLKRKEQPGRLRVYQNRYQYREDLQFNVKEPARGTAQSQFNSKRMQNPEWAFTRLMGIRMVNAGNQIRAVHGFGKMHGATRDKLVKLCKHCYYWSDGILHYNLCTHDNNHWHRKRHHGKLTEGYRPIDRLATPASTRPTIWHLPIHRLGTVFPWRGYRPEHMGNPAAGSFDKWLILRRFHQVGRKDRINRYGINTVFHKEK